MAGEIRQHLTGLYTAMNLDHFEVDRSVDSCSFDAIGIVFAADHSTIDNTYSFNDNISSINTGLIYYRLKITDINGSYKYSDLVTMRLEKVQSQANVSAYPNPAVNKLRITIPVSWQNKIVA